jgi:hypothetical protein
MTLTNTSGSRNMWYGTKGTVDADKLQLLSEGSRAPDRVSDRAIEKEQTDSHMENFLKCVRDRKTPRADVQAGFSHAVAGCMAAEAMRTQRVIRFDSERLEMV